MNDHEHQQIARWERRWLALSGLMSLTFVILIAYNLATEGAHIAQRTSKAAPEQILAQEVFANPGVRVLSPTQIQVTTVAQAFNFTPRDVRVPVGAEVEFYLTARDVIHGYQIERTNVNVELIPGEVARLKYTFSEPGTYRITCNEYCGIAHHDMLGTVTVLPASAWNAVRETPASGGAQNAMAQETAADGAALYAANCASCHQADGSGLAGAFPPVAGHASELVTNIGRDYLAAQLLFGLQGAIEVDGMTYNGVMPAFGNLSNDELAALANHIVIQWDAGALPDDFEPYTATEFADARALEWTAQDVYERRME